MLLCCGNHTPFKSSNLNFIRLVRQAINNFLGYHLKSLFSCEYWLFRGANPDADNETVHEA